jgi:succinyl-CoA synthetase beta subunit
MKIHEYQAKEVLQKFGIRTPKGISCLSIDDSVKAAQTLDCSIWVVKAQIHAGGRGKGGGVKIARSIEEVREYANQILGMQLVTHQTNPEGQKVRRLLIEEGAEIKQEFYVSMVTDRVSQRVVLIVSSEGGMEIENVARDCPEKIHQITVDPSTGLAENEVRKILSKVGVPADYTPDMYSQLQKLYKAYWDTDASLAEINPLVITASGKIAALDAKFTFDSNALFRHPEIVEYRDFDEEDVDEIQASKFDLAYVSLEGNIGCLVNGAGLAMATMDAIKFFGGEPANFLDVGGGASAEGVTEAFKIMLKKKNLAAILVNIFGGIMHCDVVAKGIIAAAKAVSLGVPLIIRMKGTNEEIGRNLLSESGLSITSVDSMEEAAKKVVAIANDK